MSVRAALPVLLLSLLALPASADLAMPNRCASSKEGDPCGEGRTCRLVKCWKDNDEDGIIGREWDCLQCMSQEQFAKRQDDFQSAKEYEAQVMRQNQWLGLAPWALGAACLATFVGYQLRREHSDSSKERGE
jgi:hypothetical protein